MINLLKLLVLLAPVANLIAADYIAASPSLADVNTQLALATTDGDRVFVPAGIAHYNARARVITNLITLQGGYGGGETIIYEDNPNVGDNGQVFAIALRSQTNGGFFRLTGFTFRPGTTNTATSIEGTVYIVGSNNRTNNTKWRIDNCRFEYLRARPIQASAWSGLIDHNYFELLGSRAILIEPKSIKSGLYGNESWAEDVLTGTEDEGIYIESNTLIRDPLATAVGGVDCYTGGRYVFRYNNTECFAGNHGTETAQQYRGGRWHAVYMNIFANGTANEYAAVYRSGSGVVFSNVVNDFPGMIRMVYYRAETSFSPWGIGSFGTSGWDTNDNTVYYSGTLTADNSGSKTLTDTNASWTVNQWANHSMYVTNLTIGGLIESSGTNTLTLKDQHDGDVYVFTNGMPYEIRKVIRALDQPGNGTGDLITYTDTPVWPNQASTPITYWGNSGSVSNVSKAGHYMIVEGRDYTNTVDASYIPYTFPNPLIAETEGTTVPNSVTINPRAYYNFRR